MAKDPRRAEALARQLQTHLQGQRPRVWWTYSLLAAATLVAVGAVYWALQPTVDAPMPRVLAIDQVAAPGEPMSARARVLTAAGVPVFFIDPQTQKLTEGRADALGFAEAPWGPQAQPGVASFLARFVPARRKAGDTARGHFYCWPKHAAVTLVEVEETLVGREFGGRQRLGQEPGLHAPAVEALRGQSHVVYLVQAPTTDDYFRWRSWMETQFERHPELPRGPVWGQACYAGVDSAEALRRVVTERLRTTFQVGH